MSEVIRRFKLMNRKYMIIVALALIVAMTITRVVLSDVTYIISAILIGACGAGLYYSLVRRQ